MNALVFTSRLNSHRPPLKCPPHFVAHVILRRSRGSRLSTARGLDAVPTLPGTDQARLAIDFFDFQTCIQLQVPGRAELRYF